MLEVITISNKIASGGALAMTPRHCIGRKRGERKRLATASLFLSPLFFFYESGHCEGSARSNLCTRRYFENRIVTIIQTC